MQGIVEKEKLFFKVITMRTEKEDVEDQDLEELLENNEICKINRQVCLWFEALCYFKIEILILIFFWSSH